MIKVKTTDISIHVPTWGTTAGLRLYRRSKTISIHVPTWGTTITTIIDNSSISHFNSRSHVGNDKLHQPYHLHSQYFNSRSHVGNDSKFSQIFFAFLCNKYNFSTFYYPFPLFFGVIRFTFLIFVVRILPVFYVYF